MNKQTHPPINLTLTEALELSDYFEQQRSIPSNRESAVSRNARLLLQGTLYAIAQQMVEHGVTIHTGTAEAVAEADSRAVDIMANPVPSPDRASSAAPTLPSPTVMAAIDAIEAGAFEEFKQSADWTFLSHGEQQRLIEYAAECAEHPRHTLTAKDAN